LVGGIGAIGTAEDQIFTGFGGDHELLACRATDGTAIGLNGHSLEAAAGKDAAIGLIHGGVAAAEVLGTGMEGIGIFHDEFAATHQAEARTDFISEFRLYLIEVDGQLAVGAQQISSQGCDHLFMGGAKPKLPVLAILQVKHDSFTGCVTRPAATALPQLRGLQLGQQGFEGPGRIHLLAHNRRHLAQHPPHQGQIGVNP